MIVRWANQGTEDVFNGKNSRKAGRSCPAGIQSIARRKLGYLDSASTLTDLKRPPGNRLEPLQGDREGQHSIRINDQYRVCFVWTEAGPTDVEIVDYH